MGLETIRENIDRVDTQMRELFLERMELSRQVIEEKQKTGGSVHAPKREKEVIAGRMEGVPEEFSSEYRMFLKQIMAISRTYQYSHLKLPEDIEQTADCRGELQIQFLCGRESGQLLWAVTALNLAGITVKDIETQAASEGKMCCRIKAVGDFRLNLAKGAVLQIYEENEEVLVEKIMD